MELSQHCGCHIVSESLIRYIRTAHHRNLNRYLLATAFWAVSLRRVIEAFIIYRKKGIDPSVYYLVQSNVNPGIIAASVWVYSVC